MNVAQLLDRYLKGKCSTEEQQMVERWFEQHGDTNTNISRMNAVQQKELMASVLGQVRGTEKTISLKEAKNKTWRLGQKIAVAASLLLIIAAAAGYWLMHRSATDTAQITQIDLAPGTDKATLTLADGSKIYLNKNLSGQLATQGSMRVQMTEGSISYQQNEGLLQDNKTALNTLTTGKGEQFPLILPDGTKVWLNAASSITYPVRFTGGPREVTLNGEAYFEVVHDAKSPFRVRAGAAIINDLGTHFNINAYADEPEARISLLEGAIEIEKQDRTQKQLMRPGQQAAIDKKGIIRIDPSANVQQSIGWKEGMFEFDGQDMESAMRQLSRWYNVEVDYPAGVPPIKFMGEMHRNVNASEVLDMLSYFKVHFEIKKSSEGNKIIVKP